jgi:hypothetical protein
MVRLGIAVVCVTVASVAVAAEPGKAIKPVLVLTGGESEIGTETFRRCTSEAEFQELWMKHGGVTKLNAAMFSPKVDFDAYMVVAIFGGQGNKLGITVWSAADEPTLIRVRYSEAMVQTAGRAFRGMNLPPGPGHGYAIMVLPRSPKAITLEFGTRNSLEEPFKWAERGKLAALPAK